MHVGKLRVLLVGDDLLQRERTRRMLCELGVQHIDEAAGGRDAVQRLHEAQAPFDLVLSDLQLRDGDGLDVLHAVTNESMARKFVLLTSVEQDLQSALSCLPQQINGSRITTLPQPLSEARLREMLDRVLQLRQTGATAPPRFRQNQIGRISQGIAAGEFHAYLEPQVDLLSGMVIGFEALARWQHPDLGLVSPADFIPQIENTPLMAALTHCMLESALESLAALNAAGFQGGMSINVGAECLDDPLFASSMTEHVRRLGARSQDLTLEITETAEAEDSVAEISGLARLRLEGFHLAIDDFGMGHSSLSKLHNGAFSEIKIDRQFVSRLLDDRTSRAAVESALTIAKSMHWICVAEGIESPQTRDALLAMGCKTGQGYLFSRPIAPADAVIWWQDWEQQRIQALGQRLTLGAAPGSGGEQPSAPPATLDDKSLGAFMPRTVPVWIFDLDRLQMVWANPAALAFWKAASLGELLARDFRGDMSISTQERLQAYRELLRDGQPITEQWTLYPQDQPQALSCTITGLYSMAGRASMLVEASPSTSAATAAIYEAESARACGLAMFTVNPNGEILWRNPAATHQFGVRTASLLTLFQREPDAQALLARALQEGEATADAALRSTQGVGRCRIKLRRGRDRSNGRVLLVCTPVWIDDLGSASVH